MEIIRQWVLTLCTLCILYSVLESILPKKEPFPVIKLVCVLYILITIISPAKNFSINDLSFDIPSEEKLESNGEEYANILMENTQKNLELRLMQVLQGEQLYVNKVNVHLEIIENNNIAVNEVKIWASETEDKLKIQKIINQFFETETNVKFMENENTR